MTIRALILFGSRARGDETAESDTDLLGWSDEAYPRRVSHGGLSLAMYPGEQLLRMARRGELFIAHLVNEALAVHDPEDLLSDLRTAYAAPSSYEAQIAAASDLGWFLVDHHSLLPPHTVNARAAWCARTIAIARTAERGPPVFSPAALARTTEGATLTELVAQRDAVVLDPRVPEVLGSYLTIHAHGRPLPPHSAVRRYAKLFEESANSFASRTVRASGLRDEGEIYF